MVGNHVIEHRVAWIPGFIGGNRWRHESTLRTVGREWKYQELPPNILLKCSVYKQNVTLGYGGNTRDAPPCYCLLTLRCPHGGGKSAFEILIHEIGCLWWHTSLVHNLRFDQPAQLPL